VTQQYPFSVLLVDSDPFMCEIFGLILTHHDIPHVAVEDAAAALAYLEHHRVSIVIVDCSLLESERECDDLVQQIRARDLAPGAKLVATSIFDWNGTRPNLPERGFDGFILKPFNISEVVPYLRELVETTTGES
jgi:DNA-binding response OmpR family regulator